MFERDRSRRATRTSLPMRVALLAVAAVWLLGCVWSFHEQSAFAASRGFAYPHLLPLVIDGLAVSMAGVSWAASLDARPAVSARLVTLLAVAASSTSNGVWASVRSAHDTATVVLGVAVPIAANLAFEVLLAELRRQVHRHRGMPAPVALPCPRPIRLLLAPWSTISEWRRLVLALTDLTPAHRPPDAAAARTAVPVPAAPAVPADRPEPVPGGPPTRAEAPEPVGQPGDERTQESPPVATAAPQPVATTERAEPEPVTADAGPVTADAGPIELTEPTHGSAPAGPDGGSTPGRRPDQRVRWLADYLAGAEDPDAVTGERVGELLGAEMSPRTGRRLLVQARELLDGTGTGEPATLSTVGGS
jgi:hypothetical protein